MVLRPPSLLLHNTPFTVKSCISHNAVSEDGKTFKDIATKDFPADTDPSKRSVDSYTIDFAPLKATFVKVIAKHSPTLPEGHSGAGKSPYLFVDETGVY